MFYLNFSVFFLLCSWCDRHRLPNFILTLAPNIISQWMFSFFLKEQFHLPSFGRLFWKIHLLYNFTNRTTKVHKKSAINLSIQQFGGLVGPNSGHGYQRKRMGGIWACAEPYLTSERRAPSDIRQIDFHKLWFVPRFSLYLTHASLLWG